MYRTIIVPLDGSARSQAALPVAAAFAHASGATLNLVRVHLEDRPDLEDDPTWDQMFREGEMSYLDSLALAYGPVAGTPVSTNLLDPPVASSLIAYAETCPAPIFIIAGRGRTGLRRALLGSTCDALVRQGETPVLVLRDRGPDEPPTWRRQPAFRRILLPLDGTAHAEGGLAHAIAIASATGAKLRLMRVVGPVVTSAVLGALAMQPLPAFGDQTLIRNDLANEYLQGIVDRIKASNPKVQVSTEVALSTDPATAIIESGRRGLADLVVVPTHGRGMSRLLVGAVGDRVLRDGPDAILFVRPVGARLPAGMAESSRQAGDVPVPVLVRG
jgi:nucleotide-binding universal stress UspA family protein